MKFEDIAAITGKGGLFKIIKPTRTGAILEALTEPGKRVVTTMQTKVSVLSDISIFTTDEEGATPLVEVMRKIHAEFNGDTGLDKNSDSDELKAFLQHILPEYDEDRVYVSDIKKLVSWYNILAKDAPDLLKEETKDSETKEATEE